MTSEEVYNYYQYWQVNLDHLNSLFHYKREMLNMSKKNAS